MKLSVNIKGEPESESSDVVFIHGTGSHSGMWSNQVEELSGKGYRCLSLDLRGHGKSAEPYESTNIDVHLNDVLETLEHSNVKLPCVFIGHSLGSIISLRLASEHSSYTKRVFLAALPGRVMKPVAGLFRVFLSGPFQTMQKLPMQEALPWRQKALLETDIHSLNQIVENFTDINLVDNQLTVDCPVHLSAGRFDPVAPYVYVKQIHRAIPNSTLKVFDLGGHNFMDYHRQSFSNWINEYID